MRRRTYLATLLGFTGGAGAGYYFRPARERISDATADTRASVFSSPFDATANELQLSPTDFDETGWENLNPEDPERDPDAIEDVDIEREDGDISQALFYNHNDGGIALSVVIVLETVDDAEEAYNEIRAAHANRYSLEDDLGLTVDNHGYRTGASVIVFRERNAIGMAAYELETSPADLNNALTVAEALRLGWEER